MLHLHLNLRHNGSSHYHLCVISILLFFVTFSFCLIIISKMGDFEELDSFTKSLVERTQQRQQILEGGSMHSGINYEPRSKRFARLAADYTNWEDESLVTGLKSLNSPSTSGNNTKRFPLQTTENISRTGLRNHSQTNLYNSNPKPFVAQTSYNNLPKKFHSNSKLYDIREESSSPLNKTFEIGKSDNSIQYPKIDSSLDLKKSVSLFEAKTVSPNEPSKTISPIESKSVCPIEPPNTNFLEQRKSVNSYEQPKTLNSNGQLKSYSSVESKPSTSFEPTKTVTFEQPNSGNSFGVSKIVNSFETRGKGPIVKKPAITKKVALLQERLFGSAENTETTCSKTVARQVENRKKEILMMRSKFEQENDIVGSASYAQEMENRKKELELLKRDRNRGSFQQTSSGSLNGASSTSNSDLRNSKVDLNPETNSFNDLNKVVNPSATLNGKEVRLSSIVSSSSINIQNAEHAISEAFHEIDNYPEEKLQSGSSINDPMNEQIDEQNDHTYNHNEDEMNDEKQMESLNGYNSSDYLPMASYKISNKLYPDLTKLSNENLSKLSKPEFENDLYGNPQCSASGSDKAPPFRTISFYRRQQKERLQSTESSPHTIVIGAIKKKVEDDNKEKIAQEMKRKLSKVKEDIGHHESVMTQTKHALKVCLENEQLRGSEQQIEAEKLLLISTQKHKACLIEYNKLKSKLADGKFKNDPTSGTISLSNFQLSVRRDFIGSERSEKEVHYIICLVYCGERVVSTQLLNTDKDIYDSRISFNNYINFDNLSSDFCITIEVYDLKVSKEKPLSHKQMRTMRLTPKKSKHRDSPMGTPLQTNPLLINTSFQLIGRTNIMMKNIRQANFKLDSFSSSSPFTGNFHTDIKVNAEYKFTQEGFLNISDDTGCWSRRYTVLSGYTLAMWRFPEDQNKRQPLNVIDLRTCINPFVKTVPIEICVKRNTFALITAYQEETRKMGYKTYKQLVSAELKEECIEWCDVLNQVLISVRMWEPESLPACNEKEFLNFLKFSE